MGKYNGAVITTAGQNLIAQAIAESKTVTFTTAQASSHVYPSSTDFEALTALTDVEKTVDINYAGVYSDTVVQVSARFDNTGVGTAYLINTLGFFAQLGTDTPILFAVSTAVTPDQMPVFDADNPSAFIYNMQMTVQNADSINLSVNPAGTVTVEQLNAAVNTINANIGDLSDLATDNKTSLVNAINEVDGHADNAQATANNAQQMIAPIQTTLVALKDYAVGEQFVYNGLLYEVTAAVASGGTLTINGNCKLANSVTNQILLLTSELNKLKNATRRTRRNITTDLVNLPAAVAEQNLEKYGYTIGDYFIGNSGYTYFLADMNTFRGANNDYAVINQNHISLVVKTDANSKWNETDNTSTGYSDTVLQSYLSGTVLNNIKSDMIALFGGSTGLEHLLSHKLLWTTAISSWVWSADAQYISALTEPQVYGTNVCAINDYQTGEAWKHLELFKKFSFMEVLGWIWFWFRSIRSNLHACSAYNNGSANYNNASYSGGVVGLIQFK